MRSAQRPGAGASWMSLVVIAMLVGVSLMTQANADFYSGRQHYDDQVIWFLFGGVLFTLVAFVDLRLVERGSYLFFGFCLACLVLTELLGTEVNNSQRWLRVGGVGFQPSELTKIGLMMALARWFHAHKERVPGETSPPEGPVALNQLWRPSLMIVIPCLFILVQPDLGTALLLGLVGLTVILYEGVRLRTLLIFGIIVLFVVPFSWRYGGIRHYQKDRVVGCINHEWLKLDPETSVVVEHRSLQSEQAIWAIGSGQFWGQGNRSGAQSRLKYLPEMHTDMIVATFAEEQGFVGCSLLLLLYWWLILWCLRTAREARDRFCRLLAVGVAAMLGFQVFINIGMVAGILPIVGLPLPFMSYGGSSVLVTMMGLGLVFNVARRRGRL